MVKAGRLAANNELELAAQARTFQGLFGHRCIPFPVSVMMQHTKLNIVIRWVLAD